ncbi:hypothetical protein L1887_45004 [Cichorium endivia]|nr:hypothetical protein L1887_45004 [Cichorium endivia]
MVFEGGKPVQHGQDHHAPGKPEVNDPRRVGLRPGIAKCCRNLEQAKDVNRLTVSRRNEIAANQDAKQQCIEGNMRGDCTDAGKFAVGLWRGGRRGNMSPDHAEDQPQHQENANAFM